MKLMGRSCKHSMLCSESENIKSDDLNTSKSDASTSGIKETSLPDANPPKNSKFFKRKESSLRPQKQHKTKGKHLSTNKSGPRSKWVPKTEIMYHSDLPSRKGYVLPKMWKQVRCKGRKAYVLDIRHTSLQVCSQNLREEEDDYWDDFIINCDEEFYRND
ncbi:hypothetical protein L195_g051808 [Trifolium pratense]|uniref:Uncharacterized protein n=1 Tax=Trifolium pratense TaxID=57577 RepID=A0A2K3K1R4_TRIPR|nr:hypothetical protein L195_g051808 [Trifolium pratense]